MKFTYLVISLGSKSQEKINAKIDSGLLNQIIRKSPAVKTMLKHYTKELEFLKLRYTKGCNCESEAALEYTDDIVSDIRLSISNNVEFDKWFEGLVAKYNCEESNKEMTIEEKVIDICNTTSITSRINVDLMTNFSIEQNDATLAFNLQILKLTWIKSQLLHFTPPPKCLYLYKVVKTH